MGESKWSEVEDWPDWVSELFHFDGTTVLACMTGFLPAVAVPLLAQYVEPGDPMGLLEKYVIRAMAEVGLETDEEIAELLGIDNTKFVTNVTERYLSSGLVTRIAGSVELSPVLERALQTGKRMVAREKEITAYCDPLGIFDSPKAYALADGEDLVVAYSPTDAGLYEELSRRAADEWIPEGCELSGVVSDVQSGVRLRREIGAVICMDPKHGTWYCGSYDPATRKRLEGPRVEQLLSETGVRDAAHAILKASEPPEEEIQIAETLAARAQTPAISIAEAMENVVPLESFTTREGLQKWKQDVASAKEEIVMFSPWISKPALDWIRIFKDLLRKGVRILVGYGISESEDTEEKSRPEIVEQLRTLSESSGAGWFRLVWVGHSHWKQTIIDRKVAYTGSFNILSFAGEPDWKSGKVRNEDVVRIVYEPEVEKKRGVLLSEFRSRLLQEARELGDIASVESWHDAWCTLLGFLGDLELIGEAVNRAPKKLDQLASCCIRLMDEAERPKSALDADATRQTLKGILADKITGQGKVVNKTIKRLVKRGLHETHRQK